MSWTNECTESNYFKVKNTDEVREVFELMGFNVYTNDNSISFVTSGEGPSFDESVEVVLSIKPISTEGKEKNLIGIISDYTNNSIDLDDLEEEYGVRQGEYVVTPIVEYLQEQLLNEQYITVTCAGFESRCSGSFSPFGEVTIITKNTVKFMSLAQEVYKFLEENTLKN